MSGSVLASLLALGFDSELCAEAVNVGLAVDVEDGVDWIVQRQGGASPAELIERRLAAAAPANATLRLGGSRAIGISSPFASADGTIPDLPPDGPFAPPLALSGASPMAIDVTPAAASSSGSILVGAGAPGAGSAGAGTAGGTSPVAASPLGPSSAGAGAAGGSPPAARKIESRYKMGDNKLYAQTKAADDYAKFRKQEREDKARLLKEIQADRERARMLNAKAAEAGPKPAPVRKAAPPEPAPAPAPASPSTGATVQLRLPDGRAVRRTFERTDSVDKVWEFAAEHAQGDGWGLVETVPPRRQVPRDSGKTVADCGLAPSASLAIVKQVNDGVVFGNAPAPAQPAPPPAPAPEPEAEDEEPMDDSEAGPSASEATPSPTSPIAPARPPIQGVRPAPRPNIHTPGSLNPHPFLGGTGNIRPGTGMTLGGGGGGANRPGGGHVATRPTNFTGTPGFPTGGQIRTGFAHEHAGSLGFSGQGRTLAGGGGGPDPEPDPDDGDEGADDAERRREEEEARRRAAFLDSLARGGARAGNEGSPTGAGPKGSKEMPTLRDAVLSRVALMLTDPKLPAAELSPLKFLSPGLADAVLAALIRQKKLDIHSLRRLAARCQLENVAMDSYRLATDSVLAILGTAGVRRLTLRGCSYVTDDGIKALAPLTKTLQHLDLSNVKVTDKSAPTLAAMRGLVHLDLSSTKITTAGLRTIAKGLGVDGSGESALETLMLAHCPGIMGNTIFEDLKPLRNLETLSLVSAQITSPLKPPTGPQSEFYPHLRVLDVSRTAVSDEDVRRIVSGFSDLKELDLKGCSGVTAVGMQNIAKSLKHLTAISFPTRDLPLDLILPALAQNRVPLAGLDLENASDISDVGLAAIAGFAPTLKTLSLAGIKTISIRALTSLLSQLDLVSLDLDRVACLSPPFLDPSNEEEAFFAASIRRYAGLESLSVAQTGVGDAALEVWNGGAGTVPGTAHVASMSTSPAYARPDAEREAQFKRILRKLNLNRCAGVTDKGVACLAGFLNLSFLNLDHTGCTQACLDSLKDLANLQKPRLLGIPPPGQVPRQEPEAQGQEFHDDFAWAGPGISLAGQRTEARAANAGQQHHAQNGENGDQDEEDEDDEMESDGEGMEMDGMEL